ncbi:hypothetical protein AWH48_16030 [Domibacillus aminovorans]|uniref:Uncharacterized protein n=1 Tax=Domibacillus aminovorans TaxID=29332 RepID=A0A177L0T2_9BACI|nr:hypothetical protein AWH48_16030 [Domibacillus aminovorans]
MIYGQTKTSICLASIPNAPDPGGQVKPATDVAPTKTGQNQIWVPLVSHIEVHRKRQSAMLGASIAKPLIGFTGTTDGGGVEGLCP